MSTMRTTPNPCKLRARLTPGTVIILLRGRNRGARMVYLKDLGHGRILISGPFKLTGAPTAVVNHREVIATSTKIDISSIKLDGVTGAIVSRKRIPKTKKPDESAFINQGGKPLVKEPLSAEQKAAIKTIEDTLLAIMKKETPLMRKYMRTRFTLKKGMHFHKLQF